MSDNPAPPAEATPLVCKHGHLARSCEICDLERQLAQAQARVAELEKDGARLAFIEQELLADAGSGLEVYPLGAEMDDAYEKVTRWVVFGHDNEGATFREALDAAISARKPTE